MSSKSKQINDIKTDCDKQGWDDTWYVTELLILITGVAANAALLWLFLREKKSLSASKVIGVNLVVMDLIYLSLLPFTLYYDMLTDERVNSSRSVTSNTSDTNPIDDVRDIFSMFNLIGCPLLLTCMCIERYLAVIKPMLYLKLRKWEYRMAVSAVVWVLTLSFCLATGLVEDNIIIVFVSIIMSCLFLLMLACLGGVVWSLWQQSPAHTTFRKEAQSKSPQKRRAMLNVLAVVVPAVMSYLPVLVMLPLVLYIYYWNGSVDRDMCVVFELSFLFPMFGVLIGPLFYLSKARQMCCLSGTKGKRNE